MGPISLQSAKKTTNVIDFLQNQLEEIEADRYKICDETDSAIQNLIDEVIALYLSTLYKLRFLA
jgi:hypothetical protein